MGLITIKDNGRGMSEDQIKKIHMFMQFDRERHEQQGLGLGLMIARRLTEIHGGNIRVISSSGNGHNNHNFFSIACKNVITNFRYSSSEQSLDNCFHFRNFS